MQIDLEKIMDLAQQIAAPLSLQVVDARVSQQGKRRSLEVTIFKPGGRVALSDCEEVSRQLEVLLEEQTPPVIDGSFLLEVQSPGIDRKLKTEREFKAFSGQPVEVKLKSNIEVFGDTLSGTLESVNQGQVLLKKPRPVLQQSSDKHNKKKSAPSKLDSDQQALDSCVLDMSNVIYIRLLPEPAM